ncbi:hypothetical protein BN961_00769 [Afipia felis]|uniref:Uncharacterized protein n=1 Tax=Afipia felis TaxID=1035 RepID=A0A090MIP0_AFIFE|nr:hypothetical protein BN961_00769 [Afipia felis]
MAGDNAVELGQGFDLIDDDLAHLRGAFGCFLRQFQHAAAQIGAGGVKFLMQFGSHLLHRVDDVAELVGCFREHAGCILSAAIVNLAHRLERLAALVLDSHANGFELTANRGGACPGAFGNDTRDIARAQLGGVERFLKQADEAVEALVEIEGAGVDRGGELFQQALALGDGLRGALVALFDGANRIGQQAAMALELGREAAEAFQRAGGGFVEGAQLFFQRARRGAVAAGDIVERGDEIGDARDQCPLQRVEVFVGAGEHFLQQDVAFTQPLEQRDRIRAQDLAGLLHFGDGGGRNLARLVDRSAGAGLDVLQRPADGAGGQLARGGDLARNVRALVHQLHGEVAALGLDRLERAGGRAADGMGKLVCLSAERLDKLRALAIDHQAELAASVAEDRRKLFGLGGDGLGERCTLLVEDGRDAVSLFANAAGDLLDLVAKGLAEAFGAGGDGALDLGGSRLDLGTGVVGGEEEGALGLARTGLDGALHLGRGGAQLRADFAGQGQQRLLGVAGAALDRFAGFHGEVGQ